MKVIILGECTKLSISAKEDFTEEGLDSGNRFLLQKNEEDCPELVGILSPEACQDGVGALDCRCGFWESHTGLFLQPEPQKRDSILWLRNPLVISSHQQGELCPLHRFGSN